MIRSIVRTLGFVRKEIVEVLRQPRLVLALILGPFAILLLFGVGYRTSAPPFSTLFVVDPSSEFGAEIESRASEMGSDLDYRGVTPDRDDALDRLRSGEVDLVVVAPEDPVESVRAGEHAVFEVHHDQLDPFQQAALTLIARSAVDTVNQRVLEQLVATGQEESEGVEEILPEARASAEGLVAALEAGDTTEARRFRQDLVASIGALESQTSASSVIVEDIRQEFEPAGDGSEPVQVLVDLRERLDALDVDAAGGPLDAERREAESIEADMAVLEETFADFRRVDPTVLVSPFDVTTSVLASVDLNVTSYYAPGVIALLLQHLAITFAGLSLVRERALGTTELFRVAPLGAGEMLAGKYIGFTVLAGAIGAALSAAMLTLFSVPMAGSVAELAGVLTLTVLASLGIGFLISNLVTSDTQAVNITLIVLLLSIFFSGFFLDLARLADGVKIVSWMLPITYAIDALRDIMFRGASVDPATWAALGGGSAALFVASWLLTRWRLKVG